jgi:hypothetical protein
MALEFWILEFGFWIEEGEELSSLEFRLKS